MRVKAVNSRCQGLRAGAALAMVVATGCLCGCASQGLHTPKTRIGALPFPGVTSLYAAADPRGVTPHRYEGGLATVLAAEGDRGIIYTSRAGFIDMAHLRESMDWTWYLARLIETSPVEDGAHVARFTHECIRAELRVPTGLNDEQRAYVAALASYRLLTWHEISTWYGYSLVAFVSEKRSTFTVDDTTSHVVGARVGRELAMRAKTLAEYDDAANEALERLMEELGAMEPSQTTRMCEMVKGAWWDRSEARLIDAHVALQDGAKRPLLAMEGGGVELGEPLTGLGAPAGMPQLGDWWTFEVSGAAARGVERVLGRREVRGDDDLSRLTEDVAQAIVADVGVRVVRDADVAHDHGIEHARVGE